MVTVLPRDENSWGDIGERFSSGIVSGYQNRADETAIQNAIQALGPTPSGRQVLDALTKTRTYSPQSKQNFLSNLMGVEKFEEFKRQAQATEEIAREKNQTAMKNAELKQEVDLLKQEEQQRKDASDALTMIDHDKNLTHDQKEDLRNRVKNNEVSSAAVKEILKGQKPTKEEIKAEGEEKEKVTTQKAFDAIADLIPEVGRSGILSSYAGGDTAKAFAKFKSLTGALEANLVDKVSRGTLAKDRFNYIINTLLPVPSDTQKEIQGKLEGIALMLDLDPASVTGKKSHPSGEAGIKVEEKKEGSGSKRGLSSFEIGG